MRFVQREPAAQGKRARRDRRPTHGRSFCPFGSSYILGLLAVCFLALPAADSSTPPVLDVAGESATFSLPAAVGTGRDVTTCVTFLLKNWSTDCRQLLCQRCPTREQWTGENAPSPCA